jgi:hypothetical protein
VQEQIKPYLTESLERKIRIVSNIARTAPAPKEPLKPSEAEATDTVPLIALAWARSGDKGDLFNVGVIARHPAFLPHIFHALTPTSVGCF